MIKTTTLLVLLGAVLLGAAVYFFDVKRGEKLKEKATADEGKSAFSIGSGADFKSLTIARPAASGEPSVRLEKRDGAWWIVEPLQTDASEQVVQRMADGIATARVAQTEPGAPDRLKVYGLDPPALSIDFQLQNGAKHSLKLGDKDFTGVSVYAILDGAKDVALLPQTLLTSTVTNVDGFRSHSVLHFTAGDVTSFDLKNTSGDLSLTKEKKVWKFKKPANAAGDMRDVNAFLSAIANATFTGVTSETPDNLEKYGLTKPVITLRAVDMKGKAATLLVGKKEGSEYFARDVSRSMIFRIDDKLYKQLTQNYAELRNKKPVDVDPAEVSRVEFHNEHGTAIFVRKSDKDEEWAIEAPAEKKGKSASVWNIFSPLTTAHADEVIDHPGAGILANLTKPVVEVLLTEKSGKKLTIQVSKESGDFVYARTSEGPAVYKLKKQILTELNFKPDDFAL
jgi:Domain of unknown function (DUF4340)